MKAKVVIAFTFILLGFTYASVARGFNDQNITGILVDESNAPVPFATVALRNATDSSLVKGELSDDNGAFSFLQVKEGSYMVEIQGIGFEKLIRRGITVSAGTPTDLGTIRLQLKSSSLQTVNVIADKPFIEKHLDKTVVNIENSIIQTNSSVIEMMEKLPGVQVNQDGVISLKGRQGVIITIDGKQTGLSGQDLGNLLKGMPSSSIQKVEIITNPSSKYDAAGNAGIINIVTKKNKRPGFNGSVTAGYGQGRYEKYNASTNLSYKGKRYNLFGSYSYSKRKGFNNLMLTRNFYAGDTLTSYFETNNYIVFPFETHNPRVGADFTISPKTSVSVLGTSVINQFRPTADNHTDIFSGENAKTGAFDFTNRSKDRWLSYSINSQVRHQFDTLGKELTVDLDYANYANKANQLFTNTVTDHNNIFLARSILHGDQQARLDIRSFKADYVNPIGTKAKFEAGAKSSYVTGESDIKFYDETPEELVFDSARSNHFLYSELINAAYANISREYEKFSGQLGVRAEQTIANGEQVLTGYKFNRNYIQLFPSAFVDYKLNEKSSLNLNVGRRIDRPGYQQMDPFRRMIDATTYAEGNPYLVPQITYNSELTFSHKNELFISGGYSLTYDNITDMLVQDGVKKVTVQTVVNLDQADFYTFNVTYSKRLAKWWNTNTSIQSYYGIYRGEVNNYAINQGRPSFTFTTSNSIFLMEGLSMEANFNYNHKNLYGVTLMRSMYNLSFGVQKQLLKKKATLTLNVTDVLWKAYPSGHTHFANVDEFWIAKRDTRVVNVNFSYRFGKGQAAKMRRSTGADEEKRRTGVGS